MSIFGSFSLSRLRLTLTAFSLLFSCFVHAHPHSWVTMETKINIKEDKIQSLSMNWEFDAMTTAYMLAGEKLTDENRDEVLSTLSSQVIYNLLSSHYFTYFYADDEPIRYKMVEKGSIEMNGAKATLKFNLELAKPTSIYTPDLRLLIFDPSYFVDMSWEHKHAITINKPYSDRCHINVVEPNPTPEQVTYAMSLSVDADPDNELGQLFTQKALFTCDPEEE